MVDMTGWYDHEIKPVGRDEEAQARNTVLLDGYDYRKYSGGMTGYNGQDLQRVATLSWQEGVTRTRVGPRGNYKGGMARLPDGKLVIAVCRKGPGYDADPDKRIMFIHVYESADMGLTWREIANPPIMGKEPSLTVLPDGALLLTAQCADYRPGTRKKEMWLCRSADGGRTWDIDTMSGPEFQYPRNIIVEKDGSLLFLRAEDDYETVSVCRSADGGKTWQFSGADVVWPPEDRNRTMFAEISVIRLRGGTLLASLRHCPPGTVGHGFEDSVLTESDDDGKTWSDPRHFLNTAEVQANLLQLADGRVLATYTNYHLPFGVSAVISEDNGKSWDLSHPTQLVFSAGDETGWAVTLQLEDQSLLTSYASTAYLKEPPCTSVCEVLHWRLP